MEAKHIAEQLKLDDRIEQAAEQKAFNIALNILYHKEALYEKAFIMLKDHKPNFPNNIKCRLINSAKSNLGKISKQILQKLTAKYDNLLVYSNGEVLQQ